MNDQKLILEMLTLIGAKSEAFKIETVGAVIRRQFTRTDGETAEVIDYYPQWNTTRTYGKMRVAVEYMDHDWQKARFSRYAGIEFDTLPIMESDTAPRRVSGQEHRFEIGVQPFRLMLIPQKDDEGNNSKTIIHRFLSAESTGKPQTAVPQTQTVPQPVPQPQPKPMQTAVPARAPAPFVKDPAEDTAYWRKEAETSDHSLMFDTAIVHFIPGLDNLDKATSTRESVFGEWIDGRSVAYIAGLEKLKSSYEEGLRGNMNQRAAWEVAKERARSVYNSKVAVLSQQSAMDLGKGNNYGQ